MKGFEQELTKTPDSENIFLSLINTFMAPSGITNMGIKAKSLYEGMSVSIFGLCQYNVYTEEWEVSKPLYMMAKNGMDFKEFLLEKYENKKFFEQLNIGYYSTMLALGAAVIGYIGFRWVKRYRDMALNKLKELYEQADNNLLPGHGPKFVRKAVGNLEISSYMCQECNENSREIIYLNCKCYKICKACHEKLENQDKCKFCQKPIENLMRVFVMKN
jgi:hypothetical protein